MNGFSHRERTEAVSMKEAHSSGPRISKGHSKLVQRTVTAHSVYFKTGFVCTELDSLNLSERWKDCAQFGTENTLQCIWAVLYLPFPFASWCGVLAFAIIHLVGMYYKSKKKKRKRWELILSSLCLVIILETSMFSKSQTNRTCTDYMELMVRRKQISYINNYMVHAWCVFVYMEEGNADSAFPPRKCDMINGLPTKIRRSTERASTAKRRESKPSMSHPMIFFSMNIPSPPTTLNRIYEVFMTNYNFQFDITIKHSVSVTRRYMKTCHR